MREVGNDAGICSQKNNTIWNFRSYDERHIARGLGLLSL